MFARLIYWVLTGLLRVATKVFFRQIEVVGLEHIPRDSAVIFAGNHPNSLIDPMLIITTCGRKVHFAAKDTLFRTWLARAMLTRLGAVPVARRDDHGDTNSGKALNDSAFAAMFDVLEHGGAIGIFPEGLSHDESQLAKLKTGAARLALGGVKQSNKAIAIVPCGLTFIHPKRFRSRVLVQYGEPIVIAEPLHVDEAAQARLITEQISDSLRRLTINAPDWNTVRSLDVVRRLYQPEEISVEDRVELARRFNTYYSQVKDQPAVAAIMKRASDYQQKLDELGISDRELARDLSKLEIGARLAKHIGLVGFWLPLTAPGAPLHLPTVLAARMFSSSLTPRKDVIATTKLMIGLGLVLLGYAAVVTLLAWKVSMTLAIVAAIVLPLSGWATLRVLDRLRLVRRGIGALVRQLRFRREVEALRAERRLLVKDVVDVITTITPAGVVPLFPKNDPRRVGAEELHDAARSHADLDAEFDRQHREQKEGDNDE